MIQSDFKAGQRWRVSIDGARLSGMKPIAPYTQQGWSMAVPFGTVLTCTGVSMTFGDGVPVVKWADADGKHLANDCTFSPSTGGMWASAPADGALQPWSDECIALGTHNYCLHLREQFEAEARQCLSPEDAALLFDRVSVKPGRWVLWDPDGDGNTGFLMVDNDPFYLARQGVFALNIPVEA